MDASKKVLPSMSAAIPPQRGRQRGKLMAILANEAGHERPGPTGIDGGGALDVRVRKPQVVGSSPTVSSIF